MKYLTLGWRMTPTREPVYWLGESAAPGSQKQSHLVRIPADRIASHTAIIAQSGAGKSFFIGRLVEEILVNTRARCLIIDPNADFRRANEVADEALWQDATYQLGKRTGKLPHERSRAEFQKKWSAVPIRIRIGKPIPKTSKNNKDSNHAIQPLEFSWTALNIDLFAQDVDPLLRSDLFHCHEFVRTLEKLLRIKSHGSRKKIDLVTEAENLILLSRVLSKDKFRETLESNFSSEEISDIDALAVKSWWVTFVKAFIAAPASAKKDMVRSWIGQLISTSAYISEVVERYYFAKVREYQAVGVLKTTLFEPKEGAAEAPRLDIVDLPSLPDKGTRLLATSAILSTEWNNARAAWATAVEGHPEEDMRVPTFIILDEAHNLIPANPTDRSEAALLDQFRTIVAEGRKYGLFLILASQRPDKLDPMVFSECDNAAIMRINSEAVLKITKQMLALDARSTEKLDECRAFEFGRVLLTGRWVPDGTQMMYTAARRTIEGGRNLRPEIWTVPSEPMAPTQSRERETEEKAKTVKKEPVVQPKGAMPKTVKSQPSGGSRLVDKTSKKKSKKHET